MRAIHTVEDAVTLADALMGMEDAKATLLMNYSIYAEDPSDDRALVMLAAAERWEANFNLVSQLLEEKDAQGMADHG